MNAEEPAHLSPALLKLLDGSDLRRHVGTTLLLVAADADGWPRAALLSVGEVVSLGPTRLRVALHEDSRTTAALRLNGRALIHVVLPSSVSRIYVMLEPYRKILEPPLLVFDGRVVSVEVDRVDYATITSGITYELVDPNATVARWRGQLEAMRR